MAPYELQNNLIALLGLEAWPEDKRQAFLDKAVELVQKRLLLRLTENLKTDDVEAVNAAAGDDEKVMAVLAERSGLDVLEVLQEEVRIIVEELKPLTKKA